MFEIMTVCHEISLFNLQFNKHDIGSSRKIKKYLNDCQKSRVWAQKTISIILFYHKCLIKSSRRI